MTVDSLAWRVLKRWRSFSQTRFGTELGVHDYAEVCRRAGVLLNERLVAAWVARAFPMMLVDEMQDSRNGQLHMIQGLGAETTCLAAADGYQDLEGGEINPAVMWARERAKVISLTQIHRTKAQGLLEAAHALRSDRSVPTRGQGLVILGAPSYSVGAKYVSQNLTWWGRQRLDDVAIITPVRVENARFVRRLLDRVEAGPIGKEGLGPHRVQWELSSEDEQTAFLTSLNLPGDPTATVLGSDISLPGSSAPSVALRAWLDMQRRVAGRRLFTVLELERQVGLIHQRAHAYQRVRNVGVRAMTVHQAKNREFQCVIVLWPYEVKGSAERLRRMLYNAITRAKYHALVVVENPERMSRPPFVSRSNSEMPILRSSRPAPH